MRLAPCLFASAIWLAPRLATAQTIAPPVDAARLHVDGSHDTKVLGRPSADSHWIQICTAPCDVPVPLGWEYQVRASGMKSSPMFQLHATAGQSVALHVLPAYTGWFVGGIVAIGAGGAGVVVGLPLVLLDSIRCGGVFGSSSDRACDDAHYVALFVVAALSTSLIAFGTVATVTNHSTTVSQDDRIEPPATREPVWHDTEQRPLSALPPAVDAPLMTLRF
jgi:hypothetical protein